MQPQKIVEEMERAGSGEAGSKKLQVGELRLRVTADKAKDRGARTGVSGEEGTIHEGRSRRRSPPKKTRSRTRARSAQTPPAPLDGVRGEGGF